MTVFLVAEFVLRQSFEKAACRNYNDIYTHHMQLANLYGHYTTSPALTRCIVYNALNVEKCLHHLIFILWRATANIIC